MSGKTKTFYMDGVDWKHEIGGTTVMLYETVEALKSHAKCWDKCGIVKLEIREVEWVEPQRFEELEE